MNELRCTLKDKINLISHVHWLYCYMKFNVCDDQNNLYTTYWDNTLGPCGSKCKYRDIYC